MSKIYLKILNSDESIIEDASNKKPPPTEKPNIADKIYHFLFNTSSILICNWPTLLSKKLNIKNKTDNININSMKKPLTNNVINIIITNKLSPLKLLMYNLNLLEFS